MANPELDNYIDKPKRPLVALLMADCFFISIFNGEKTITIRDGLRDYQPGEKVILCSTGDISQSDNDGWAVMAKITSIKHSPLNEVDTEDLNADGMKDLTDAVYCLRDFYPNIHEKSPVTVIRWKLT